MIHVFFRDIYYSDVVFFGSQGIVDDIIDNLSCMIRVPRHCLHVVSLLTLRSLFHSTLSDILFVSETDLYSYDKAFYTLQMA